MYKKFIHSVAVLDKLIWKCTMSNLEIHDVLGTMNIWLDKNIVASCYEWYSPPYVGNETKIEHNGERFFPCICFKDEDDLRKFIDRFSCIK